MSTGERHDPQSNTPDRRIERAHAKLNLLLAVDQPDDSGMHPICSWMAPIDLHDELTVTRLPDDRFSRYAIIWHDDAPRKSDIDWPIVNDLAVRAHLALETRVDGRLPVQMKLEKRIPVAAGLGGGSSDAAAMLRAMNDLFELRLDLDELSDIAAALGSDVPFFLWEGAALVEGSGELITDAPIRELWCALVFPEERCPTGHVYAEFDAIPRRKFRWDEVGRIAGDGVLTPDAPFNDLAEAAMRIAPGLRSHVEAVATIADRPAHITGSGSSIFVICDDAMHAEFLANAVREQQGLAAIAARTI